MTDATTDAMTDAPTDPALEIEIDELTLHGFDPRARDAIGSGLQAELAEALTGWRPGTSGGGEGRSTLDAGEVRLPSGTPPTSIGRALGSRVGRAIRDADEDDAVDSVPADAMLTGDEDHR